MIQRVQQPTLPPADLPRVVLNELLALLTEEPLGFGLSKGRHVEELRFLVVKTIKVDGVYVVYKVG